MFLHYHKEYEGLCLRDFFVSLYVFTNGKIVFNSDTCFRCCAAAEAAAERRSIVSWRPERRHEAGSRSASFIQPEQSPELSADPAAKLAFASQGGKHV
jgi:hypothetical protein